jgi:hypothetical protein
MTTEEEARGIDLADEEEIRKIDLAVEKIERYIDTKVAVEYPHGVVLSPKQVDDLVDALIFQGFKNAARYLDEASKTANHKDNLTQWAALSVGAGFLENNIKLVEKR